MTPLSGALVLGLALLAAGCSPGKQANETSDLETVRAELKEKVAKGELTTLEAQVKLAEAFAETKRKERAKGKATKGNGLQALGMELKAQVKEGKLSAEDAAARFTEARKKAQDAAGSNNEKPKAPETGGKAETELDAK